MWKKILSKISRFEAAETLKNLIEIPSVSGNEEEIGHYLAEKLEQMGVEVKTQRIEKNRSNILGRIEGDKKTAPRLILEGHMDTIEAYDMLAPFTAEIKDGNVCGRGAVDMKGGVAAILMAAKALAEYDSSSYGKIIVAFTVDEEKEKKGGYYLLNRNGVEGDMAIVAEPTNNQIAVGQMGIISLEVTVKGRSCLGLAHGKGVNAIEKAAKFVGAMEKLRPESWNFKGTPISGYYFIYKIDGGHTFSTIPSSCRVFIKRATFPGETKEKVLKEINETIEKLERKNHEFQAEVRVSRPDWKWPVLMKRQLLPALISENETIVETLKNVYKLLGKEPKVTIFKTWTHQDFFVNREPSIPAVILGPGNPEKAHSQEECIQIEDVVDAAKIYALTACLIGEKSKTQVNK